MTFASDPRLVVDVRAVNDHAIGGLFDGVIEATEEAILNALVAAETMTGRDGYHRPRPAPRPAARDDGPVRQAGTPSADARS